MRYITAIIFASLATALVVMYVLPTYRNIETKKEQQASLKEYIEKANQAQARIDELDRQYQTFPVNANEMMTAMLPSAIDDVLLSMQLTDLAKKHGLSLANPSIRRLAADKGSSIQEYSIGIGIEAPYNTLLRFLNDIEYSLHIRNVTALSISAGENAASPMKISMEFITYSMK